ncbi:glycoside hydrolase family 88/105 protein [Aridibaculum aurantiacum]|uniref:glycoside hydrolase family 88/105 protein n=1 Tax=Aridibaculum aurantiacum TaxID=2810307 RepID=UPI001A95D86C|nr:glycoside hydrolase family 88 protein [Aridibaculum aurantiacum]
MNKHRFIIQSSKLTCITLVYTLLIFSSCTSSRNQKAVAQGEKWSQQMVESHGLKDFYTNKVHHEQLATTGWDYVTGLIAFSVLKAWEQYPDKMEYYNAVKAFADKSTSQDGSQIVHSGGKSALGPSNIDDLAAGRIFLTLYTEELKKGNTKDAERYKNALTLIRNKLKHDHARIKEGLPGAGGFWHKAQYPNQMWLDGLYMGAPVYALWQTAFGAGNNAEHQQSWTDIAHQFKILHKHTYDAAKQLNYHAWSATPNDPNSFWANKNEPFTGASKEFWGRGMGWYFAALVDVLELMPKDHPDYAAIHKIFNEVAAGLKRWQDKQSGVWYQLLQYDSTMRGDGTGDVVNGKTYNACTMANYLEASCSSIFTYAYLKGMRLGLLDKRTYRQTAEKAYEGLLKNFARKEGSSVDIIQVCASAGLGPASNPARTGTVNYYLCGPDVTVVKNEGKAIGTFILASVEYERYLSGK